MPPPRQLALTTPLGPDALTLVDFTARESISRPFDCTLDLVGSSATPVAFDRLLGRPMTVGLGQGRFFNGIVARFSAGARNGRTSAYRAELVPQLWLLTRSSGSRSFQHRSVPQIVEQVLSDHGQSATFELHGNYAPRTYCVQYRETAFDFASRLLEEEGIWFTFRHSDGAHTLVIGDATSPTPDLGTFAFDPRHADRADQSVQTWEKTQELTPGKFTVHDHSFLLPTNDLEGSSDIVASVQAGQVTHPLRLGVNNELELYDFPGGYAERFDAGEAPRLQQAGALDAALRMQATAAESVVVDGSSSCRPFTAGATFGLAGHFDGDGAYVLTRVEHSASQPATASGAGGFAYANTFTCVPAGLPYRPPRRTGAPVAGPQPAVVTGPAGTAQYTDVYGRVKVKFFWDRTGQADENSSCWIRVSQAAGGGSAGTLWIPEVGDEVLVAFEHGDPDRPYVVGRLWNDDDRPPDHH